MVNDPRDDAQNEFILVGQSRPGASKQCQSVDYRQAAFRTCVRLLVALDNPIGCSILLHLKQHLT